MRTVWAWPVFGTLLFAPVARADDGEEVPLDKLPAVVTEHINREFPGAESVDARIERVGGKECYTVTILRTGRVLTYYVSPDGTAYAHKDRFSWDEFFADLPLNLLLLLPFALVGGLIRWAAQAARQEKRSVGAEWLAAWAGSVLAIGILMSQLATVPRHKDVLVLSVVALVWGAVAASIVEALGLIAQSFRGYRVGCRRWILGCCGLAFVFLCLSIPVEILRIHRENQYYRALAMRSPAG